MLDSRASRVRQCEEQCLLDMLEKANEAVPCVRVDMLAAGAAPNADNRAGWAGAAHASCTNIAEQRRHTGGPVSSACEGAERACAAPANASGALLPGAGSPGRSAADAGAAARCEHSSMPITSGGVQAGRARAVAPAGAALPGTHDGSAGKHKDGASGQKGESGRGRELLLGPARTGNGRMAVPSTIETEVAARGGGAPGTPAE